MTTTSEVKQKTFLKGDDAMAKTMTASKQMTDGQIENVVSKLRDALRKHRSEFGSEPVQQVLGFANLGMELLAPFRKHVEAMSNLIIRRAKVDRNRTPQQVLDATGRNQYTDRGAVETMPKGEGKEVDVYFFNLGRYVSDDELEEEYELRGLVPDPYAQAAVNEANPAFSDEYPNGCHWKYDGKWHFATFDGWPVVRHVHVRRYDAAWRGYWWFCGVRK